MNLKSRFIAVLLAAAAILPAAAKNPYAKMCRSLPFEMEEIAVPRIPAREFRLDDFGGRGDGVTLNTEAFARAVEAVERAGGGRLSVPAGVWLTGPIELCSRIELHLEDNAIVVFSTDKDLYPIVPAIFEGLDTYRCQSPISAVGQCDVAITGRGIIDGSGDAWRAVKRDKVTASAWSKLVASGGVVSSDGKNWFPSESYALGASNSDQNVNLDARSPEDFERIRDFLRPVMISLRNCERVMLKEAVFQNSPCWNIHPVLCRDLIVDGITIRCPWYAQNGDGIDIESCTNVVMRGCSLDVGDDGICVKSGKDEAGRRRGVPCRNVVIEDCAVYHAHGGFVVGSEMSGGVENVYVDNCRFSGTDVGLRFKSTRGRGGVVKNIFISNVSMNNILTEALLFDLFYGGKSAVEALESGDEGDVSTDMAAVPADETTPEFRDIHIRNIACHGARRAMFFNGLPEKNVSNVTIENSSIWCDTGIQINETTGAVLRNVRIVPRKGPALMLNNVRSLRVENLDVPAGLAEAMAVTGSRNADIEVRSAGITPANSRIATKAAGAVNIE